MDLLTDTRTHRPLIGNNFRLLTLQSGSFDDPIHCQLKQVSLSDGHAYEALSYVWGNASDTSPMSLDGTPYHITKNLECALRYLRHKEFPRVLWVDAVCINQRDIQERSAQVSRMKHIYEQATQVVIWLGDYAPYTREQVESALQFADRLTYLVAKDRFGPDAQEELIRNYSRPDNAIFRNIRVVMDLTSRPWFSRVWVIQEVAVCKIPEEFMGNSGPIFVYGWSSIFFYSLSFAATKLHYLIDQTTPEAFSNGAPNNIIWIHELRRLRNELITGEVRLTLVEQLTLFLSRGAMGFQATDERDKIYALLGLLLCDSLPPALQPNYAYSAEQVFWNYAVYILKGTKCLDVLTCSSNSRQGLPSWVPDWKTGFSVEDFHLGKISHLRFLEDNKKIEVDCMVLGQVYKVLHPVHIPFEFKDVTIEYKSEERTEITLGSHMALEKMVRAIVDVYKTLLVYETKWFGCRALDANLEASQLQGWISGLTAGFRTSGEALLQGYTVEVLYKRLMNIQQPTGRADIIEAIRELLNYCAMIAESLKFCLYEDNQGNFGRPRNRSVLPDPGDVVCYLRGSSFKFLLRLENSECRLVGATSGNIPISKTELKDMGIWEDFWEANKAKVRRVIIH